MELFNPLKRFMCVFLWCLGNYFTSADNLQNTGHACHHVQREFVHRKIGPVDLVPNNPVYGKYCCYFSLKLAVFSFILSSNLYRYFRVMSRDI